MKSRALFYSLKEYSFTLWREDTVHLMLEHVQNLFPALLPLVLADFLPISENQRILQLIRGDSRLIVIYLLGRQAQRY